MAYNVLKGIVDGSVDQHGDQEIGGIKVFKNTISASVFYDTDAQSPCATMKDVAIKKIKGGTQDGILICDPVSGAKTNHKLRYSNDTLNVENIKAATIEASAELLHDIPSDRFSNKIPANFIEHSYGLHNIKGKLQVNVGDGLRCDEDGIEINLQPNNCLSIKNDRLAIDPASAERINSAGQNLSDDDLLIVADVSSGLVKKTDLSNFYASYINLKVPHAAGSTGELQIKGKNEFEANPNLRYESASNTLQVNGKVKSNAVVSKSKMVCEGAVYNNITATSDVTYDVNDFDHTIICDASDNEVSVNLPAPQNNRGRMIIVKKVNKDKYKLNSNLVHVLCDEGKIDLNNKIDIKMNFSTKTFQSDGESWLIIGSYGN